MENNKKLNISDVMCRFKKWLREPMSKYDKFYAVIVWLLMILSLFFWNDI
jgi:hypothetical protein